MDVDVFNGTVEELKAKWPLGGSESHLQAATP
jgi:hypothetical protein